MIGVAARPSILVWLGDGELEHPPTGPEVMPSQEMDGGRDRPTSIIVVDDDEWVRGALSEMMKELGLVVLGQGSNGMEAVELVGNVRPDVVLMDLRMPMMDGLAAARLIKRLHPSVQIVILSAFDDPLLRDGARESGVTTYLAKGCKPTMIRDAVSSAAARYRDLGPDTDGFAKAAPGDVE